MACLTFEFDDMKHLFDNIKVCYRETFFDTI